LKDSAKKTELPPDFERLKIKRQFDFGGLEKSGPFKKGNNACGSQGPLGGNVLFFLAGFIYFDVDFDFISILPSWKCVKLFLLAS